MELFPKSKEIWGMLQLPPMHNGVTRFLYYTQCKTSESRLYKSLLSLNRTKNQCASITEPRQKAESARAECGVFKARAQRRRGRRARHLSEIPRIMGTHEKMERLERDFISGVHDTWRHICSKVHRLKDYRITSHSVLYHSINRIVS